MEHVLLTGARSKQGPEVRLSQTHPTSSSSHMTWIVTHDPVGIKLRVCREIILHRKHLVRLDTYNLDLVEQRSLLIGDRIAFSYGYHLISTKPDYPSSYIVGRFHTTIAQCMLDITKILSQVAKVEVQGPKQTLTSEAASHEGDHLLVDNQCAGREWCWSKVFGTLLDFGTR